MNKCGSPKKLKQGELNWIQLQKEIKTGSCPNGKGKGVSVAQLLMVKHLKVWVWGKCRLSIKGKIIKVQSFAGHWRIKPQNVEKDYMSKWKKTG